VDLGNFGEIWEGKLKGWGGFPPSELESKDVRSKITQNNWKSLELGCLRVCQPRVGMLVALCWAAVCISQAHTTSALIQNKQKNIYYLLSKMGIKSFSAT
jgi:hypothetical protein